MSEKKMKIFMTIAAVVFAIIVVIIVIYNNIDFEENTRKDNKKVSSSNSEQYRKFKGIITNIDDTNTIYTVRDYNNINEVEFEYKEGCEIKNIYGKEIFHDKLKIGDVVVIGYENTKKNLKYIHIDSNILQFKNLKKYKLDTDTYYIELDDTKYRLNKETFVYCTNKEYSIYEIDENDVLTLNIKGKDILSVIVEKGHGKVSLANSDSFIGYHLIVNDDVSYEIKKGLEISVPEGKNVFTIKNEKLTGSVTLNNIPGYDRVIDVNKIQFVKKKEGKVKFYIEPKNARLYINGNSYNYEEEITLDYGTYKYVVESSGYNAYAATMTINSDMKTLSVHLYEKKETEKPSEKEDSNETSASPSATTIAPSDSVAPTNRK